ncbi:ABC transporter ATP-binding protein [Halosimplex rubrum]|uniref:ABC transporter ATP-binding protein n=1 Tax=Halosimplex rubrum TaxID=869889 RepID=A0A7D5T678_9EURY|nr:ABC transporter ATP-binding protein [Halosimplex rubrum]QLH77515.1 ABC transporter ATP-binding protein [Halosimplex rubrum]
MTATLVAEDVRRSYGETVALDGVSLSVDAGEVFALVGPNGAGKTTLVRALTGTTDAEGTVELFGDDPRDVDRERVGLLPQAFDPPARLTARELLDYYAGLYDEAREVEAVLDDVGLADAADTYYETLSGGQQRRTCVGSALVNDPDLLFLDEPTTGIDPAGRRALWDLLESLADRGTTIVLTTHDMDEAHRLADRVGLLADGRLVAADDPDTLVAEYGGESRLVVETGADPAGLDLPYPAERAGDSLVVSEVPPEAIGEVVDALATEGASYDALTWSEPDLEDVYLELASTASEYGYRRATGRTDRHRDAAATDADGPAEGER